MGERIRFEGGILHGVEGESGPLDGIEGEVSGLGGTIREVVVKADGKSGFYTRVVHDDDEVAVFKWTTTD